MKKLKLKALELGATEVLTRAQLKNILGGSSGSGGGTSPCAADGLVCHEEDGLVYTCSTEWEGDEVKACCCSHSGYNHKCGGA